MPERHPFFLSMIGQKRRDGWFDIRSLDQIRSDILLLWRGNVVLVFGWEHPTVLLRGMEEGLVSTVLQLGFSSRTSFTDLSLCIVFLFLKTVFKRESRKLRDCEAERCIELLVPDLRTLAVKWVSLSTELCLWRLATVEIMKCGKDFFLVASSGPSGESATSFRELLALSGVFSSLSASLQVPERSRLFSARRNSAFFNWFLILRHSSSASLISFESSRILFSLCLLMSWNKQIPKLLEISRIWAQIFPIPRRNKKVPEAIRGWTLLLLPFLQSW